MKRKIPLALFLFSLLLACSLGASYNLHCLLSGRSEACTVQLLPILDGLRTIPETRKLFFILACSSALFILWLLAWHNAPEYQSRMRTVIPGVLELPEAAGQGQYGTASWLPASEFGVAFDPVLMDLQAPVLRELMDRGADDLEGGHGRE